MEWRGWNSQSGFGKIKEGCIGVLGNYCGVYYNELSQNAYNEQICLKMLQRTDSSTRKVELMVPYPLCLLNFFINFHTCAMHKFKL